MTRRVVLDTNVIVSLLGSSKGAPAGIGLAFTEERLYPCLSGAVIAEYETVLRRPSIIKMIVRSGRAEAEIERFLRILRKHGIWPEEEPTIEAVIEADPKDDMFRACAVACEADAIVSGDKHVLALQPDYRGIPILTPRQFLDLLEQEREGQ